MARPRIVVVRARFAGYHAARLAATVQRLRDEVEGLRRSHRTRAIIGQAEAFWPAD